MTCNILVDGRMQAIKDGLGATTEKLATPLNITQASARYSSPHPKHRLIAADVNACSCKWQGALQAHPGNEAQRWKKY